MTNDIMKLRMQRLRVKFSCSEEIKYISHLDLMRCWERALRRADIPLAYSEGFSPHPRISLAAPLPIGVTSEAELMDVFLDRRILPSIFIEQVSRQLPLGLEIVGVEEVPFTSPSLQSQLRCIEYRVEIAGEMGREEVEGSLRSLLQAKHLPWQHKRDTGPRHYDLRRLIDNLWAIECRESLCALGMRLRSDSTGTGRPEQVFLALGLSGYPRHIHRTRLIFTP